MKIIQSFWTGKINHISENNFGWVSPKYNLISWVLSANQLKKYYENVELYTDELGARILIDTLKLPYSKVHIVLNTIDHYHKDLWAISKIKTYSLQNEPFLHVDGDVFIWDTFPEELMKAPLITQNLEKTTDYYRNMWKGIEPHLSYIPEELNTFNSTKNGFACNMGIVGGVDLEFYKHYTSEAFKFVDTNKNAWDKVNKNNFNVFFEQLLYYELAKKQNIEVDYLFKEIPDDNKYIGFGDFYKVPNERTYLHLLGNYKKDKATYKAMEHYVLKFYPDYYKRVLDIFDEHAFFNDINYNFSALQNQQLIADFTSTVQTKEKIGKHYFLSRDIASIGLSFHIQELIRQNEEFILYKLPCSQLFTSGDFKEILIKDHLGDPISVPIDDIDQIVISELTQPIRYNLLIEKLTMYLDDDVTDSDTKSFISMINDRITFFASRKVISIVK
ncbi:DUF6734 family protein [Dokdonia ponticola]|uniref:DUF6734 family protein n=1 Tax=Dokdonia ponticola TaxID=2041041 RepID=A0ABV9I151_9FLAO